MPVKIRFVLFFFVAFLLVLCQFAHSLAANFDAENTEAVFNSSFEDRLDDEGVIVVDDLIFKDARSESLPTEIHDATTSFDSSVSSVKKHNPPCFPNDVLLVSTLDGKITALDLKTLENGALWSVDTGTSARSLPEPLLSSSTGKIVSGNNWIVPSLDGMLYKFYTVTDDGGQSILRSTAISSDEILDRSMRLEDGATDTTIYGGKETTVIGVNARNGLTCYFCDGGSGDASCSADSTDRRDCGLADDDDLIVIRRVTYSVKALKTRTGEQWWNYSVAQNHLRLEDGSVVDIPSTAARKNVVISTCGHADTHPRDGAKAADEQKSLRFRILDGRVIDDAGRQFHFGVPIADAWLVSKGKLTPVNLFDSKVVEIDANREPSNFLTFLGCYQEQYYLQHSTALSHLLSLRSTRQNQQQQLEWSRVAGRDIEHDENNSELPSISASERKGRSTVLVSDKMTALAVHAPSILPGVYLSPANERRLEIELSKLSGQSRFWRQILRVRDFWISHTYAASVGIVTSVLSLVVSFFVLRLKKMRVVSLSQSLAKGPSFSDSGFDSLIRETRSLGGFRSLPVLQVTPPRTTTINMPSPSLVEPLSVNAASSDFESRFYQDFEPVACLGKGGFGVVFEARNKLDDCCYAIKRVALKNKPESKERVMREVKALAKLDHHGVVRYYQAWFESPPVGWDDPFMSRVDVSSEPFTATTSERKTSKTDNKATEAGQGDRPSLEGNRYQSVATSKLIFNNADVFDDFAPLDPVFSTEFTESSGEISFRVSNDNDSDSTNAKSPTLTRLSSDSGVPPPHPTTVSKDSLDVVFELSTGKDGDGTAFTRESSVGSNLPNFFQKDDDEIEDDFGPRGFFPVVSSDSPEKKKDKTEKIFLYIQMQLCKKETLKDWLRDNMERDHRHVLDIFVQILDTVQFLHAGGLIHRDIKPSNIFFAAADGTVKIGDFGLVTDAAIEENQEAEALSSFGAPFSQRQHTDQVGTKLYMSPEQASGKNYCQKVDIYSLGIVLFELLNPFATEMERGRTLLALRQDRLVPETLRREKKKETGLVLQMIHPDPDRRPSAEEVKEVVEELEMELFGVEGSLPRGSSRRRRGSLSRCSGRSSRSVGSGSAGGSDESQEFGSSSSKLEGFAKCNPNG